jgi:hypothetical protein
MLQSQPKSVSGKFVDPNWTASGEARAWVAPTGLETLLFNTGTLCNIACHGCYIESTPRNDESRIFRMRKSQNSSRKRRVIVPDCAKSALPAANHS